MFKQNACRISLLTVVATTLLLTTACTKNKGLPPSVVSGCAIDSSRLVNVTYAGSIQPLISTYCTTVNGRGCHVTGGTEGAVGIFDNYQGVKDKVDDQSFENRVFKEGDMPPADVPQMSCTDKEVLKKWLSMGAQNN